MPIVKIVFSNKKISLLQPKLMHYPEEFRFLILIAGDVAIYVSSEVLSVLHAAAII